MSPRAQQITAVVEESWNIIILVPLSQKSRGPPPLLYNSLPASVFSYLCLLFSAARVQCFLSFPKVGLK